MHHVVDDVGRVVVRRRTDRLATAALIHADVHDHRPRLHHRERLSGDQRRATRAGDQHRPDHQIGRAEKPQQCQAIAEYGGDVGRHHVVEIAKPVDVHVHDDDPCAQTRSHFRRVGPDHAAPEDQHLRRFHPGHAAQQNPPTKLRMLEVLRTLLNAHLPRDFAHRRQQRQPPTIVGDGLVGHGDRTALDHAVGQRSVGGEVEVGEHHLTVAHHRPLAGLGLFHLHDHVGLLEHHRRTVDHLRADRRVVLVQKARVAARPRFHQHPVTSPNKLIGTHRRHTHAILVCFCFLGYPDNHDSPRSKSADRSACQLVRLRANGNYTCARYAGQSEHPPFQPVPVETCPRRNDPPYPPGATALRLCTAQEQWHRQSPPR